MSEHYTRISRYLSYVLRHRPDELGLQLDDGGWIDVDVLLAACAANGRRITNDDLAWVVAHNDKGRFAFDGGRLRIRATQGHSVPVELGYEPAEPPELLFHGTAERFLESIRREGLVRGSRHHVHLSADAGTAKEVGTRHGRPAVLEVRAGDMARVGHVFFLATNGVWLTDAVPSDFLREIGAP